MKKLFKNFIKFIKNGKLNIIYYYKCISKLKIDEFSILLCSQQGKDINGNIFYILKELSNTKYKNYKKYIAVNREHLEEFKNKFDTYNINDYEFVVIGSRKFMKALAVSKYLFNDTSFLNYFIKRKEQVYFNTWHGTPYKTLGKSIKDDFHLIGNVQRNFLMSDYLLYPSDYMKNNMINDYMINNIAPRYTKVVLSGYPRNEIFLDKKREKHLRKIFKINKKQVIMYMPTWRGSFFSLNGEGANEQIEKITNYLDYIDEHLKDNQIMYVNFHPFLKNKINISGYKRIFPFDKKYETYDFLNMADILITDYSSVFFDFAVSRKKIILFAYDQKEYFEERGTYFDYSKLPFAKVSTTEELINEINSTKNYDTEDFINTFCKYESNDASKIICDLVLKNNEKNVIIENIPDNGKKNILIYSGNLNKNGITSSLFSLLNNINLDENNYYLCFIGKSVSKNKQVLRNLDPRISYISFTNNSIGTLKQTICNFLYKKNLISYKRLDKNNAKYYENEIRRKFGDARFDSVIQFTGYGDNITRVFSKFKCKKYIYVHSNMLEEIKLRKNQKYETLSNSYKEYDNVIIVNNNLLEPTREISGKEDNIITINNVIDKERVLKKSKLKVTFDEKTISNVPIEDLEKVLKSKKKKIITIGRFSPEKGYERLIKEFIKKDLDAYLIIVGGFGPLYNKLNQLVENSGNNRIFLIKDMSNPFPILAKSDVMFISSFYEGLPMVLYEALILNIPVISTNIPSISGFFEKYCGGYIVDNSDDGISTGLSYLMENKIKTFNLNVEEYNSIAIEKFLNLINGEVNEKK